MSLEATTWGFIMTDEIDKLNAQANLKLAQNKDPIHTHRSWMIWIVAGLLLIIFASIAGSDASFLQKLKDIDTARGLITFVVAAGVMSIAMLTAGYVMASTDAVAEIKEKFGYVKDVLATLVGIFGTVLGFYYASQLQSTNQPLAVEFQIRGSQLIGRVTGSAPPFRYSVSYLMVDGTKVPEKVAIDAWILEEIPSTVEPKTTIQIEVIDAKDHKLSKAIKFEPVNRATVNSTEKKGTEEPKATDPKPPKPAN
jgi:hypothetical protein